MKPYTSYKDSGIPWIGSIPDHWECLYLFQVADEHYISNKYVHHQNLLSLSYGKIIRKDINKTEGLLPASFDGYQIVESGNIVLRLTDLQNDQRSLRVGFSEEKGIVTSAYLALQASERISPKYLYFQLHSNDIHKVFYGMGGGLRQGLNWNGLRHLPVIVPPVDEQEAIVRYIDEKTAKIDRYITEQERLLSALDELRQAEIARAVTRGLNPDVPLRNSGIDWIGSIPAHWERVAIKRVLKHLTTGKTPPAVDEIYFNNNGIPWITPGDFKGTFRLNDGSKHLSLNGEKILEIYPAGAVLLIGIGGTMGKVVYTTTETASNQQINALIFRDDFNPLYGAYYLTAMRDNIFNTAKYTTLPILNQVENKKIPITVPPLDEQRAIVEYLDEKTAKIDRMKADVEKQIGLLKEYKQRIISDAVTGKVDVRNQSY